MNNYHIWFLIELNYFSELIKVYFYLVQNSWCVVRGYTISQRHHHVVNQLWWNLAQSYHRGTKTPSMRMKISQPFLSTFWQSDSEIQVTWHLCLNHKYPQATASTIYFWNQGKKESNFNVGKYGTGNVRTWESFAAMRLKDSLDNYSLKNFLTLLSWSPEWDCL